MISGDRGLAGAYNTNIVRHTFQQFGNYHLPVRYITVGRKGRDMMIRRGADIMAEFSDLPAAPSFADVSAIGRLAVEEFLEERADEVYLAYTDFFNMIKQVATTKKLLPLEIESGAERVHAYEQQVSTGAYLYEPGEEAILNEIVPRFTALQVYQAIMELIASEHAARMVAMKNATDNATEMSAALQLEYNKARQQTITSEMLDIAGGAEALAQK